MSNDYLDRFDRLWTPFRMQYVQQEKEANPFLRAPTLSDEDGLIFARGRYVYALLNLYPYNPGHSMVVPYRQESEIDRLRDEELCEMMFFTRKVVRVIKSVTAPHGFNIGFNLGRCAGGSVTEHIHQHIVPRWTGDASFMTVISETKIMIQLLHQTRELFAQAWRSDPLQDC